MRLGVMIGADGSGASLDDVISTAKGVEAAGLDDVWLANIFSFDAISTLSIIGRENQPHWPGHRGHTDLSASPHGDRATGVDRRCGE